MNDFFSEILSTIAFAGLGAALLAVGYWVIDLVTPGHLGRHVFIDHRRDASLVLGATLLSVGGIVATSIWTVDGDTWETLGQAGAFGLIGVLLQAGAFLLLDLLTPGRLGEMMTDDKDDPAVWVVVAVQIALGLIVMASLT